MSKTLAIHLTDEAALVAVVSLQSGKPTIDASREITFDSANVEAQAKQLAAGIEAVSGKKLAAVIGLSRDVLQWQNYQLPPAPAEELFDMVAMQASRDHPLAGQEQGFDYLSLEGDDQKPHRVLGVGISQEQLQRILKLCESANVKAAHLVPRPLGWAGLIGDEAHKTSVTAALETGVATIWAKENGRVTRLRSTPLPAGTSPAIAAKLLTGELRRTQLTLQEVDAGSVEQATVWADGSSDTFEALAAEFPDELPLRDYRERFERGSSEGTTGDAPAEKIAPLVGMAADMLRGNPPLLDLLNPRRGPEQANHTRTWILAGVAAAALLGFVGWLGYESVNGPLRAAADAAEQTVLYQEQLEGLAEEQQQYQKVEQWQENTVNVLDELTALSERIRPTELSDKDFPQERDVLTLELDLTSDEWTLTALAKEASAAEPLESRLRNEGRRVTRQALKKEEQAKQGYQYRIVEKLQPADVAEESP